MVHLIFWIFIIAMLIFDINGLRGNWRGHFSIQNYDTRYPIWDRDKYDNSLISRVLAVYVLIIIIMLVIMWFVCTFLPNYFDCMIYIFLAAMVIIGLAIDPGIKKFGKRK